MFKKGDIVKCIESSGAIKLDKGVEYIVVEDGHPYSGVSIEKQDGTYVGNFCNYRFELVINKDEYSRGLEDAARIVEAWNKSKGTHEQLASTIRALKRIV